LPQSGRFMSDGAALHTKISTTFRHDIVKELLKSKFNNSKNKISDEAVDLVVEIAKVMAIEASARACYQAQLEDKTTVTLDQVECILAQLCHKPAGV
ncbi:hypothetical protein HUJ04_004333, partial [Dendroctonus ponderosae]